jgi:hypothetical protein
LASLKALAILFNLSAISPSAGPSAAAAIVGAEGALLAHRASSSDLSGPAALAHDGWAFRLQAAGL